MSRRRIRHAHSSAWAGRFPSASSGGAGRDRRLRRGRPPGDPHHPRHQPGRARDAARLRRRPRAPSSSSRSTRHARWRCRNAGARSADRLGAAHRRRARAGDADGQRPNLLLIEVDYRVRATNAQHNLVYPFYLEEGARAVIVEPPSARSARRAADLLAELLARARAATCPSGSAGDRTPGTALARIAARYLEAVIAAAQPGAGEEQARVPRHRSASARAGPGGARAARLPAGDRTPRRRHRRPAHAASPRRRRRAAPSRSCSRPSAPSARSPARSRQVVSLWPGRDEYIDHTRRFAGRRAVPAVRTRCARADAARPLPRPRHAARARRATSTSRRSSSCSTAQLRARSTSAGSTGTARSGAASSTSSPACSAGSEPTLDSTDGLHSAAAAYQLETDCADGQAARSRPASRLLGPRPARGAAAARSDARRCPRSRASASARSIAGAAPSVTLSGVTAAAGLMSTPARQGRRRRASAERRRASRWTTALVTAERADGAVRACRSASTARPTASTRRAEFDFAWHVSVRGSRFARRDRVLADQVGAAIERPGRRSRASLSTALDRRTRRSPTPTTLDVTKPFFPLGLQPQPGSDVLLLERRGVRQAGRAVASILPTTQSPLDQANAGRQLARFGRRPQRLTAARRSTTSCPGSTGMGGSGCRSLRSSSSTIRRARLHDDRGRRASPCRSTWRRRRSTSRRRSGCACGCCSGGYGFTHDGHVAGRSTDTVDRTRSPTSSQQPPALADLRIGYAWQHGPFHPERRAHLQRLPLRGPHRGRDLAGQSVRALRARRRRHAGALPRLRPEAARSTCSGSSSTSTRSAATPTGPRSCGSTRTASAGSACAVDDETRDLRAAGIVSLHRRRPTMTALAALRRAALLAARAASRRTARPARPTVRRHPSERGVGVRSAARCRDAAGRHEQRRRPTRCSSSAESPVLPGESLEVRELAGAARERRVAASSRCELLGGDRRSLAPSRGRGSPPKATETDVQLRRRCACAATASST